MQCASHLSLDSKQMLAWASLQISRVRTGGHAGGIVSWTRGVHRVPALLRKTALLRSPSILPTPLCAWQPPFQCFYSIQGPARSGAHTAWDLCLRHPKATRRATETETGRLLIGQERFRPNAMFLLVFWRACCWTKNRFVTSFPRPRLNVCSWPWRVILSLAVFNGVQVKEDTGDV